MPENREIMNLLRKNSLLLLFYALLMLLFSPKALAQQSIVIVPSADVLPKDAIMIKASSRLRPFNPDRGAIINQADTYGLGNNGDLTVGVSTLIFDETNVRMEILGKKMYPITDTIRLSTGARISPYLSDDITPLSFIYTHLSKQFRKTDTRLTSGVYMSNDVHFLPDKVGAILGVEQGLIRDKLLFVMDWTSGNLTFTGIGVGLKYHPHPDWSILGAVLIPNGDKNRFAFYISISKRFYAARGNTRNRNVFIDH